MELEGKRQRNLNFLEKAWIRLKLLVKYNPHHSILLAFLLFGCIFTNYPTHYYILQVDRDIVEQYSPEISTKFKIIGKGIVGKDNEQHFILKSVDNGVEIDTRVSSKTYLKYEKGDYAYFSYPKYKTTIGEDKYQELSGESTCEFWFAINVALNLILLFFIGISWANSSEFPIREPEWNELRILGKENEPVNENFYKNCRFWLITWFSVSNLVNIINIAML
jgi:hypothetical protein